MMRFPRLLPIVALLLAAACSSGRRGPETGEMPGRRQADLITRQELSGAHATDVYEAVRTLRPAWLRKRGTMSVSNSSDIVVYLDNVQLGGPQMLRSIPVNSVTRMQFLDASSATQRWGTNHVHGAILVVTM